jgi:predicted outer membrane repeat protein
MTIANSTISGNTAVFSGGAIYNTSYNNGTVTITNCTITGNSFYGDDVRGGGILG